MNDTIFQFKGTIYEEGYGLVAKKIMKDNDLTVGAKALYSYLCSYAGSAGHAFPGRDLICHELNISKDTFNNYKNELLQKGYLTIEKVKNSKKQFDHNNYIIESIPYPKKPDTEKPDTEKPDTEKPDTEKPDTEKPDTEKPDTENLDTTINNTTSNNLINNNLNCSSTEPQMINKDVYSFYEKCGFGLLNSMIIEMVDADVELFTREWVIDAMKEAVRQNRYKFSYVEGILRNWKADGRNTNPEKEAKNSGVNKRTNKQNYTSGPSKETLRLEEIAREEGLFKDGEIKDTECDF